jgi:hypothetical protein
MNAVVRDIRYPAGITTDNNIYINALVDIKFQASFHKFKAALSCKNNKQNPFAIKRNLKNFGQPVINKMIFILY